MANYLSTPIETLPPSSSLNTALIAQVQGAKQGQYNLAKQQINQTLDTFENLKVLGIHNQEYIQAKLTDLKSKLDASAYKDLSDINLSDNLMSQIKTAAKDPFIVDAMANTAKFNNFQTHLAELKKKDPKLYNDANYAYAMYKGGVQEYIEGKSNGIGSLNYTPYMDLSKEHLDRLKTLKDIKGKRVIQERDGNGGIIERSIDGLSEADIRNYFGSTMTSQELQQMTINGWAKYGQNPQETQKLVSSYYTENVNQVQDKIEEKEAELRLNLSSSQKENLQKEIDNLKETKTNFQERISGISKVPIDSLALELEKTSYLNGLAEVAKAEWSVTYKADDVYFKTKDLEVKYEELALKKQKHLLEMAKLSQETGLNADGTPNAEISVSSRESDTDETTTIEKVHNQYYKDVLDQPKAILAQGGAEADVLKARLKTLGLDANLNWINPTVNKNKSKADVIDLVFSNQDMKEMFPEESMAVSKSIQGKRATASDLIKVESDAYSETFNKNPDKYIKAFERNLKSLNISLGIKGNSYPGTHTAEALLVGNKEEIKALETLKNKMETFIKNNGGVNRYKEVIAKDKNKLREFANLTEEVAKISKPEVGQWLSAEAWLVPIDANVGIWHTDENLKEDAQEVVKTKAQEYGKSGVISTMTANNAINVANPATISNIVNKISSEQYSPTSANFDKKELPITIFRGMGEKIVDGKTVPVPGIWIEQHQGTKGTGSKEAQKKAMAFVEKGDAAYSEVNKLIDIEEQGRRGYDMSNPSVSFKTVIPTKYKVEDRGGEYSTKRKDAMKIADAYNMSVGNVFQTVSTPAYYIDDFQIKETFSEKLKGKYEQQEIEDFIEVFVGQLGNFRVDRKVSSDILPGTAQRVKQMDVIVSNNNIVKKNGNKFEIEKPTGASNIDPKLMYLIETFPQTFVADYIMKEIESKKPKKLTDIFN